LTHSIALIFILVQFQSGGSGFLKENSGLQPRSRRETTGNGDAAAQLVPFGRAFNMISMMWDRVKQESHELNYAPS
jgi:hypothetical protein